MKFIAIFVVALLLVGCEENISVPVNEGMTCSSNGKEIHEITSSLDSENIPHLVKRIESDEEMRKTPDGINTRLPVGDDCVFYSWQYSSKVEKLNSIIIGEFPPIWGRSTSWDDRNEELVKILSDNEIPTEVHIHRGKEWIAWPLQDAERAEKALEYEDWRKELMKEQREKMYPPYKSKQQGPSAGTR